MLFELINPSDPYTFEAVSREVPAVATVVLERARFEMKASEKSGECPESGTSEADDVESGS
jgi:hypothetical protein